MILKANLILKIGIDTNIIMRQNISPATKHAFKSFSECIFIFSFMYFFSGNIE